MNFGLRVKLGTSLFAAMFLLPVLSLESATVFAQEANGTVAPVKKKATPLPPAKVVGKVVTETEVVTGKNNAPMLTAESAVKLQELISKYQGIADDGGFPKVAKGNYKKGATSDNVIALNKRLFMDGYVRKEAISPEFANRVTSATIDGVTRFQRNMGLAATGVVDGPTLAALNVPVGERIRTMQANIARLQAYSLDLGERYLVVNVPSMQIETVNNGKVFSRHNAIVGQPSRPTPVVMTALSDVNFNPYWNAPASIVENDLFPKMRSGTRILEDMNIRVFQGFGGPEIDPKTVNWSQAVADDYHFRQEPGPASAMATAKINFPSPFGIYLHDTPEKHLFKSAQRFYSSGCVRVEKVGLLLEWILNGQEGIGASEIAALEETLERRDVKLEIPPQLRVAYLTAWPVGNSVAFRNDVYDLDGTGFVVGQPLPTGEVSEEGQRFVLKPVPRSAKAVEDAEAQGIGLFGRSFGKSKPTSKNKKDLVVDDDVDTADLKQSKTQKQLSSAALPTTKKKAANKKDTPGLFDWAAYRKAQKQKGKAPAVAVKPTKKVAPKKATSEVAAVTPKEKVVAVKKPVEEKTLAKKPVVEKVVAKKPVEEKITAKKLVDEKAVAKKPDVDPAKKVAVVDPKTVKKPVPEPVKKPVVVEKKKPDEVVKKVAEACKPDAAGKLPKDCKPPAAKKP